MRLRDIVRVVYNIQGRRKHFESGEAVSSHVRNFVKPHPQNEQMAMLCYVTTGRTANL